MRIIRITSLAAIVLAALLDVTLAADKDEPVFIEADRVDIDQSGGVSTYQGNVRINQGSLKIVADRIEVRNPDEGPQTMRMSGNPASFRQKPSPDEAEVRGEAKSLFYNADTEHMTLEGDAVLWRGEDQFSSDLIEYFGDQQLVKAGRPKGDSGRVHMILQPKTKQGN